MSTSDTSGDLYHLIGDCLPNDHARQVQSHYYIAKLMRGGPSGRRVVDLGCGDGRSVDRFRTFDPDVDWHGLDIESSPEVAGRTRTDATFHSYNGVDMPFEDASVHIVYSHQVFEHVRHPEALLGEIHRVLRPGGSFIGSVSYLEPYHSFSLWNFTPYGWHTVLTAAGLRPLEFRPGIDSLALIQRQYHSRPRESRGWFDSSPLNEEMDAWGERTGRRPALINLRKLQFCGHLVFHAERPLDIG